MSLLYVYAFLAEAPTEPFGVGLASEPLSMVRCGELVAAAGAMPEPPSFEPSALQGHDATVRRLARATDTILPARFGSFLADADELRHFVEARGPELRRALALVQGCEQMTLRVFGALTAELPGETPTDVPPVTLSPGAEVTGPGARYLNRKRLERQRGESIPEIASLRSSLAALVRAEHTERHKEAPLLASVYHLVPRGQTAAYAATVEQAAPGLAPLRIVLSGPWPPYAFAPEGLS